MITYLTKESYAEATYARPYRQRAFAEFLARRVPGSICHATQVGGSSASVSGAAGAVVRLLRSIRLMTTTDNAWVVLDYPNFPASVPRRPSVFLVAAAYLLALRACCALKKVGVVVQIDDDPGLQDQWLGMRLTRRQLFWERTFERWLLRSAHRLWTCGLSTAAMLSARFGIPASGFTHVPNGGEPAKGDSAGCTTDSFKFVYAGALSPDTHGVKALIEAFAEVKSPRARLMLAGPGGDWIAGYLQERPDARVEYLGCLKAEDAQSLMRECQIGVLCGGAGGYYDIAFPGKLGAYLAAGLPVLTTCGGDAVHVIESHRNGIACSEGDLAPAMSRLVEDAAQVEQLKRNATAVQEGYSWDSIYARAVRGLGVRARSAGAGAGEMTGDVVGARAASG